jgi:hypothetical protein
MGRIMAIMGTSLPADVKGSDLAIAVVLTAAVFGGSFFALLHSRLEHEADFPVIDPGVAIPIAVRPVADLPAGGGLPSAGGDDARASAVVPLAWRRKVPRASVPTEPATPHAVTPSQKHKHKPAASPEEAQGDSAVIEPSPVEEPGDEPAEDSSADVQTPEDSQVAAEGGEEVQPPEEGEQEPAEIEPETAEGEGQAAAEGEGEAAAEGEGEAATEGGSEGTDPLLERAIEFYRARLVAWFSARFRVTGSGLSQAQLAKYRVRVHIEVGDDLRIVDFDILSSDHSDFDKAARVMLEKLRGTKLPAPPENYPGAVQRQLTVTFTCAEDTCD